MYIIKNALRCIGRAKGRNILIGIIALVAGAASVLFVMRYDPLKILANRD